MFGTVLAMVKTSACSWVPRAAASSVERTKPLSRETVVPAAMTALEESTLVSRWLTRPPRRRRGDVGGPAPGGRCAR